MFEPCFARKVFPTFDDPYFRFNFTFTLKLLQDTDKILETVLFNTPLIAERSIKNWRLYEFESTVPVPAYLVGFAVLNKNVHRKLLEFEYFGIPIRFFQRISIYHRYKFLQHKKIRDAVKQIVLFTLSYCESHFEIPWKMSKKIDFLLTKLGKRNTWGGMENVGLITIDATQYWHCTNPVTTIR